MIRPANATGANALRMRGVYRDRLLAGRCPVYGGARDREGSYCSGCVARHRTWRRGVPDGGAGALRPLLRAEARRAVELLACAAALLDLDDDPRRLDDVARCASLALAAREALGECAPEASVAGAIDGVERLADRAPSPRRAASLRAVAARLRARGSRP